VISVIVLTLDEEVRLPACLAALAGQAPHELIVVDGGSTDRSVEIARAAGARVIVSEPGRAAQANRGAAAAARDILLFVHADTRLAPGALELVERTLSADPGIVGGSFTLRFDHAGAALHLFEILGGLYHRVFKSLYGDRGIFIRRGAFRALHGFRPLPFMEDYDLGRRLPRLGRICILRRPVTTSAREFDAQGPFVLGAKLCVCLAGFRVGVAPQRLRRFYYGRGGGARHGDHGAEHGGDGAGYGDQSARRGDPGATHLGHA
jgi:rSAM/selenodomain-associated transferase 2